MESVLGSLALTNEWMWSLHTLNGLTVQHKTIASLFSLQII